VFCYNGRIWTETPTGGSEIFPGSHFQGLEKRAIWKTFISVPCATSPVPPVVKLTGEGHHHHQDKSGISQLKSKEHFCTTSPKKRVHRPRRILAEL